MNICYTKFDLFFFAFYLKFKRAAWADYTTNDFQESENGNKGKKI